MSPKSGFALGFDRLIAFEPFWGSESVINVCVNERDLLYGGARGKREKKIHIFRGGEIEVAQCALTEFKLRTGKGPSPRKPNCISKL